MLIFEQNARNNLFIKNESFRDINIIGYKINYNDSNFPFLNTYIALDSNVVFSKKENAVVSIVCIPDRSFKLDLLTQNNRYVTVNVGADDFDAFSCNKYSLTNYFDYNSDLNVLVSFYANDTNVHDTMVDSNVGADLVSGWDFTSGWTDTANANVIDADTFETEVGGAGGVYKPGITTIGKKYKLTLSGSTNDVDFKIVDSSVGGNGYSIITGGFGTADYTAVSTGLYLRNSEASKTTDVTVFSIQEICSDLVNTSTTVQKTGDVYSAVFDGADSKVDTGTDMIGTKAVTVMGWIKPSGWGEGSLGRIIDNGKFYMFTFNNHDYIGLTSAGSSPIYSSSNSISLNNWQFVSVTREADGTVNYYIGDLDTAPALSGSADQNSGVPVAGTTNVIIGNNNTQTRTFDGLISNLQVVEGIVDLNTIIDYYNLTKSLIKS